MLIANDDANLLIMQILRIANIIVNDNMKSFSNLVYPDLSYKITGILFKVHNDLGRYCNEKQYSDLAEKYFKDNKIPYAREFILPASFDGERKGRNKIDFLIYEKIILELKTKRLIERQDYYQLKRYLIAINKKLGLLVNFRSKFLDVKRILNSNAKADS